MIARAQLCTRLSICRSVHSSDRTKIFRAARVVDRSAEPSCLTAHRHLIQRSGSLGPPEH